MIIKQAKDMKTSLTEKKVHAKDIWKFSLSVKKYFTNERNEPVKYYLTWEEKFVLYLRAPM